MRSERRMYIPQPGFSAFGRRVLIEHRQAAPEELAQGVLIVVIIRIHLILPGTAGTAGTCLYS